jgi:hypothetical protein
MVLLLLDSRSNRVGGVLKGSARNPVRSERTYFVLFSLLNSLHGVLGHRICKCSHCCGGGDACPDKGGACSDDRDGHWVCHVDGLDASTQAVDVSLYQAVKRIRKLIL